MAPQEHQRLGDTPGSQPHHERKQEQVREALEDCGGQDYVGCIGLSRGMRACYDLVTVFDCTTDNDCPAGKSGIHGHCWGTDSDDGSTPGDGYYHTCYLPLDTTTFQTSCW